MENKMQDNITTYYPDLETVRKIDSLLTRNWGIDYFETEQEFLEKFSPIKNTIKKLMKASARVEKKREAKNLRSADETELMRLMADHGANAAFGSKRRHLILDNICLSSGLIKRLPSSAKILDIGCHNGMLIDILSQVHPNEFTGIDPIGLAIHTAKKRTKFRRNVSFHKDSLPYTTNEKFNLVLCFDVLHHLQDTEIENAICNIANLTEDGGIAVVSTNLFNSPEWKDVIWKKFYESGLGFEHADIQGGLGGIPPKVEGTMVVMFRKGNKKQIPIDIADVLNDQWRKYFKPYFDKTNTLNREKTQSFERAQRDAQNIDP